MLGENKMTDITKCANTECTIKNKCYRHTAPDGPNQSYAFLISGTNHLWGNKKDKPKKNLFKCDNFINKKRYK